MLGVLKTFVVEFIDGEKNPKGFSEDDDKLATAALLLHAAAIDGKIDDKEQDLLRALLKRRFSLDDAATNDLIEQAISAEEKAIDLYHFTHALNQSLDAQGRLRLIEMMWQIAFADGHISEYEENLIWRVADLLGVSSRDRISLRQRVVGRTHGR